MTDAAFDEAGEVTGILETGDEGACLPLGSSEVELVYYQLEDYRIGIPVDGLVGREVTLSYSISSYVIAAPRGWLAVQSEGDIIYLLMTESVFEAPFSAPVGVTIEPGQRAYRSRSRCGVHVYHDLIAEKGGQVLVLPYGEVETTAGLRWRHGGCSRIVRGRCTDVPVELMLVDATSTGLD